jgi:hypothetical protein
MRRFSVTFLGESGVDAGGLTTELYQQFFETLFSGGCALMSRAEDGYLFLPAADDDPAVGVDAATLRLFEGVGRFIVKRCAVRRRVVAIMQEVVLLMLLLLRCWWCRRVQHFRRAGRTCASRTLRVQVSAGVGAEYVRPCLDLDFSLASMLLEW